MNLLARVFGRKPLVEQSEYSAGKSVSIWVGDFGSEDELDEYLRSPEGFSADYGFTIDDRSGPEISVEVQPVGIEQLLTGFSLYAQFLPSAIATAKKDGVEKVTSAAVFHHLAYPRSAVRRDRRMRFLGCFGVEGFR